MGLSLYGQVIAFHSRVYQGGRNERQNAARCDTDARNKLAASEPYRPEVGAEVFVPSGEFPTPNHEIANAPPYQADDAAPGHFLAWPVGIDSWENGHGSSSSWAEEAFAKACAAPQVFIPADLVLSTSRECGSSNFAAFMRTHGFRMNRQAYLDGPLNSVNWDERGRFE